MIHHADDDKDGQGNQEYLPYLKHVYLVGF